MALDEGQEERADTAHGPVRDASSAKPTNGPHIDKPYVRGIAIAPDGKHVLLGYSTGSIELWDFNSGTIVREWLGRGLCWAFSPDGKLLLSGGGKGYLWLSDPANGKLVREFQDGDADIEKVAFSSNGKLALTGSRDGIARVWDLDAGEVLRHFGGQKGVVRAVAFSPNSRFVLVANDEGDPLRMWSLASGKMIREFGVSIPTTPLPRVTEGDWYRSVSFSPTGRYILSGGIGGLKLWEVACAKQALLSAGHRETSAVAFTPDATRAVSGGDDGSLRLWDAKEGVQLRVQELNKGGVQSILLAPDGKTAIALVGNRFVVVWNLDEWRQIRQLWNPYPNPD
jgi:WD40 repeat protein